MPLLSVPHPVYFQCQGSNKHTFVAALCQHISPSIKATDFVDFCTVHGIKEIPFCTGHCIGCLTSFGVGFVQFIEGLSRKLSWNPRQYICSCWELKFIRGEYWVANRIFTVKFDQISTPKMQSKLHHVDMLHFCSVMRFGTVSSVSLVDNSSCLNLKQTSSFGCASPFWIHCCYVSYRAFQHLYLWQRLWFRKNDISMTTPFHQIKRYI